MICEQTRAIDNYRLERVLKPGAETWASPVPVLEIAEYSRQPWQWSLGEHGESIQQQIKNVGWCGPLHHKNIG